MIAALFVETNGPYFGLELVDPWDSDRDARTYPGPFPVVAHPPCERWGKYWSGGPSARTRRFLGDDNGCFEAALKHVRAYGGVLEHPAFTHAYKAFELARPPISGGWVDASDGAGFVCHVEQGHYGHAARKATWLYYVGDNPPGLMWGRSSGIRLDEGFHSNEERRVARAAGIKPVPRLNKNQRIHTPAPFRDLLLELARSSA